MGLGEIDVVIMGLATNRNDSLQVIVAEDYFVFVDSRLLRNELEHKLLALAYLEDAFLLAELEARWNLDLPLRGFLAHVPDHDRLLGHVLHWHLAKVEDVWEVEHGSAADCSDWHDELLPLGQHHEIVGIVRLGLW